MHKFVNVVAMPISNNEIQFNVNNNQNRNELLNFKLVIGTTDRVYIVWCQPGILLINII